MPIHTLEDIMTTELPNISTLQDQDTIADASQLCYTYVQYMKNPSHMMYTFLLLIYLQRCRCTEFMFD